MMTETPRQVTVTSEDVKDIVQKEMGINVRETALSQIPAHLESKLRIKPFIPDLPKPEMKPAIIVDDFTALEAVND